LKALADANELLTEHISKPVARVEHVVRTALRPFVTGSRLELTVANAELPDGQVINLALALHELGTNATKYGAWSVASGKVNLVVHDTGEALKLTWLEEGGPTVQKPKTAGFGSRLLRRLGKNAVLLFRSGGVEYSVELRKVIRPLSE
jgi:two-component sensor histidine kinase